MYRYSQVKSMRLNERKLHQIVEGILYCLWCYELQPSVPTLSILPVPPPPPLFFVATITADASVQSDWLVSEYDCFIFHLSCFCCCFFLFAHSYLDARSETFCIYICINQAVSPPFSSLILRYEDEMNQCKWRLLRTGRNIEKVQRVAWEREIKPRKGCKGCW